MTETMPASTPTNQYERMAAHIVGETRNQVLTTKTTFTTIADSLDVNYRTVSRGIERPDMMLSMFLACQLESGGDPAKVIADSLNKETE